MANPNLDLRLLRAMRTRGHHPPLERAAIALGKAGNNGAGWFVVHLAATEAGDARGQPQLVQATRTQFSQVVGEEYAQQFTRAIERQLEVERNEDAIADRKSVV